MHIWAAWIYEKYTKKDEKQRLPSSRQLLFKLASIAYMSFNLKSNYSRAELVAANTSATCFWSWEPINLLILI